MAALTIVSATGFLRGPTADETGINCSKFSLTVEPEVKEFLMAITDQARGFAVGDPMGKLTIEGEFNSTLAGVMLAVFTTAFVPTNSVTFFGRSAGGFYLNSATVDKSRGAWNSVTAEFESRFNIA